MPKRARTKPAPPEFPVVGIGASAGGITALQSLFQAIPAAPNLAFVVVQHQMPNQTNPLVQVLGRWTPLPVREATEGVAIAPNCVFVAPSTGSLELRSGVFTGRPRDGESARPGIDTIDSFFESLALDCGRRAVAVVLSGTGKDGAAGVVRVKQADGMVLVQEPATALHDGMPRAAIATGAVDHILPLRALAGELCACASPGYVRSDAASRWADEVTQALDGILTLIRVKAGFDFTGYKTTPLLWRIQGRMEFRRVPLFRDYVALLHDDATELETLLRSIPIHVTAFFRDAPKWEALEQNVIPRLFSEANGVPVRTWTPACATGEEAYSLGMLLAEHAGTEPSRNFQVFATDAAPEIVARAGQGTFSAAALEVLSPKRRQRFFYAVDGAFRVTRALREKMVFAPQDLLADPPFSGLDLVTCRNLLIYLERDAAERVLYLLHSSLRMGGYLFLGSGESLPSKQRGFEGLGPGLKIYRKSGALAKPAFQFPKHPSRLRPSRSSRSAVEAHAHEVAAEKQELPAVLINDQFQMVRVYGDLTAFLRFKPGEPTLHLPSLLRPEIAVHLEAAAQKALSQQRAFTARGLPDPATGKLTLRMRVTPLDSAEAGTFRLLISFLRGAMAGEGADAELPASAARRAGQMEWGEALRVSHEELEASREELQALNEELRAANDQLNLANDDLAAVNAQLRAKLDELETQSNVLSSGAVTTLFVDHELRVRWYTPAMRELFPLLPGDAGRLITDLAPRFHDENFVSDVHAVMEQNEPREAEVCNVDGKWFLRRIGPYLAQTASGVAVTFTDISERKRVEHALRESEERQAFLLQLSDRPRPLAEPAEIKAYTTRLLGERLGVNRAFYADAEAGHWLVPKAYERDIDPLPDVPFEMAYYGSWIIEDLRAGKSLIVNDMANDHRFDASQRAAHQALQIGSEVALPLVKGGKLVAMLVVHAVQARDWTSAELRLLEEVGERTWAAVERARAEAALRESEARQTYLLKLADALRPIADPLQLQEVAARVLGEHLGATRVYYGEVAEDDEHLIVEKSYVNESSPLSGGRFRMRDFGAALLGDLRNGRTLAVDDTAHAAQLSSDERKAYEAIQVRALAGVPLVKHGRLVAYLHVHKHQPHAWKPAELALIEETAERTWAAVELARVRRRAEELNAFLVRFSDQVRELLDPRDVAEIACRLVTEKLGVERAYWSEVDWATREWVVGASFHVPGVSVLQGRFPFDSWEPFSSFHLAGRSVVVDDTQTDARLAPEIRAGYRQLEVGADLVTPILANGRLRCVLAANQRHARRWLPEEVALLQGMAGRCWAEVERARATSALRATEERLRLAAAPKGLVEVASRQEHVE